MIYIFLDLYGINRYQYRHQRKYIPDEKTGAVGIEQYNFKVREGIYQAFLGLYKQHIDEGSYHGQDDEQALNLAIKKGSQECSSQVYYIRRNRLHYVLTIPV